MLHTGLFICYVIAFHSCRKTGNAPLVINATFTMISLSTWPLSPLTSGKAVTSMTLLENVLSVSPAATPRRTLHLTSKPWRTQNLSRHTRAGARWRTAWVKTSRTVWGSVQCPSRSQQSTSKHFQTTRTKENSRGMVRHLLELWFNQLTQF